MSDYLIGKGKIYIAKRHVDGYPLGFVDLGNCPRFILNPGTSGIRNAANAATQLGAMQISGNDGSFSMELDEFSKGNLSKALYGSEVSQSGDSVGSESVRAFTGMFCPTAHINISSVSIVGKTLGTNYTVEPSGGINVLSGVSVEGESWNVSYTYETYNNLAAFSEVPELMWVRFNGLNIAEEERPMIVDIYKARINPGQDLKFLDEGFSTMQLGGIIQYDDLQPSEVGDDIIYGNYFRVRTP